MSVKLTIQICLLSRLKISGAIRLHLPYAFMACTGKNLPLSSPYISFFFPSISLSFCSFLSISFSTSIILSLCLIYIPSTFFFGTVRCFLSFLSSYLFLFFCTLPFLTLFPFFLVFYFSKFILLSFCFNISPFLVLILCCSALYAFLFYLSLCIGFCLSLPLSFLLRHLVLRICKVKTWQELKS